ncbi:MAG: hypothetical protein CMJ18_09310 [Phycisphaeraceae bacterium]|nr:hypothetical protein [Phycisphaeraceae bacterium]
MYLVIVVAFVVVMLLKTYMRRRDGLVSPLRFWMWTLLWVGVLAVSLKPQWTDYFTQMLGIERGVDLLMFLSILGMGYLIFLLYAQSEKMRQDISELTRQLALSELEAPQGGEGITDGHG